MYIYRFNFFNGRYYCYDSNKHDIVNDPLFDFELHDNSITPNMSDRLTCGYCNTRFMTRTQLFYHLGFMNIDIISIHTNKPMETEEVATTITQSYDPDAGEFGFVQSKRRARKLLHFHNHLGGGIQKPCHTHSRNRNRYQINILTEVLSKISLDKS